MMPTVGRIVIYTLSQSDVDQINRRRTDSRSVKLGIEDGSFVPGIQVHIGNEVHSNEQCAAIVVKTFGGEYCNLQVLLDGNDTFWASSRCEGFGPNMWQWPKRED